MNNDFKILRFLLLILLNIFIIYIVVISGKNKNRPVKKNTIIKREINNINCLQSINTNLYKKYMLGIINESDKIKIDRCINKEVNLDLYKLKGIPKKINKEIVKSSIIYYFAFTNRQNKIFSNIVNIRLRIKYTSALLASIGKIETGYVFNYNHKKFSRTGAYGRFQIIPSTAASIYLEMILKDNIDFYKIQIQNNITFYKMCMNYAKNENEKYILSDNEIYTKGKKYLKYLKKLNKSYKKILETRLSYYKYKFPKKYKCLYRYISKSNINKYKLSIRFLKYIKNPVNQGVFSLIVIEDIYNRQSYKYNHDDKIIYNTLKFYNNDKTILKDSNKEMRTKYAEVGSKLFKEMLI